MDRLTVNCGHPTVKLTFTENENVYHIQSHYHDGWVYLDDALYCTKCSWVNQRAFMRFGVRSSLDRLRDMVIKYGLQIPESSDTIKIQQKFNEKTEK